MPLPSRGVGDQGAADGEDSSVFAFPLTDDEGSHDLSYTSLTTIHGWVVCQMWI